ncbi:MAG: PEP-CTERM sorting domain-containing protein [Phycisphaerae bacterium]|nr:PEP-CTERM sorting domain-containing protein [Phycisphaerae bacterium]
MITKNLLSVLISAGAVAALALCTQTSQGQITGVISSNVEGFFGSTSDTYQQSEAPLNPPWTAVGFALPYGPAGLPNIPALYAGYPNPATPITQNIGFAAPAGHAPASPFTDGVTSADYHIYGGYSTSATYTRDAYVRLGNSTTTLMYLDQPSTATGYAYEEAEFAIDYNVNANGLTAGATPNNRPYLVSGSFLPGGSAEFGAQVNYWWIPTVVNTGTGVIISYGTPVNLGSLQYQDYLSNVTGSFSSLVQDTYSSNYLAGVAPGQTGILELTGDMYLIGDPVSISVEAVPEPATVALVALGGLALIVRRRKTA